MNSFQVLDADGQAITIKELDRQAAELWSKEVDGKYYASPAIRREGENEFDFISREMSANWFDQLGYTIANQEKNWYELNTWERVIHCMLDVSKALMQKPVAGQAIELNKVDLTNWVDGVKEQQVTITDNLAMSLYVQLEYAKPYVDLVNLWISKGYTPKQIKA